MQLIYYVTDLFGLCVQFTTHGHRVQYLLLLSSISECAASFLQSRLAYISNGTALMRLLHQKRLIVKVLLRKKSSCLP